MRLNAVALPRRLDNELSRIVTVKHTIKIAFNFERNLEELAAFLTEVEAPHAFDALLDELTDIVIPNLESFPDMGRLFLKRSARSVEVANGIARLTNQLGSLAQDVELREYVMPHYRFFYGRFKGTLYMLSIRHHRQLSFDVQALWPES